MERRRERPMGAWALPAALILTALAVWLFWSVRTEKKEAPAPHTVLVRAEEAAHG